MSGGTLAVSTTSPLAGLTAVQQVNSALASLAGLNQASSAPTTGSTGLTSLAGVIWHDTSTGLLKIRNQADTAWIPVGYFDETNALWSPLVQLGQCRLGYSSATQVKLSPFNGNFVAHPTLGVATIPSAGISATNSSCYVNGTAAQTLANSTFYYAYLAKISGSWVLDFSTTGHATESASGIEIKSGDSTRVLVGAVYTNSSGQFADSVTERRVVSWFNRRPLQLQGASIVASTASASFVELSTSARIVFAMLGTDALELQLAGYVQNSSGASPYSAGAISLDGAAASGNYSLSTAPSASAYGNAGYSLSLAPAEGGHYVTIFGLASAGTMTLGGNIVGVLRG